MNEQQFSRILLRYFRKISFLILYGSFLISVNQVMAMQEPRDLYDFTYQETSGVWMIVNDGVMGGISESRLSLDHQGFLVFEGRVSLDYGGGFASVRSILNRLDADSSDGILIRFKGDGKRYQLRLRQGDRMDGVAYFRHFETKIGEWEEVFLPFHSFQASYRGRRLPDYPKLDTSRISQLGLMISDKQEGNFRLEVQRIALYFNEHFQT